MKFVKAGRTFIYETQSNPVPHLWMVLTEPDAETDLVVMVPMVTSRGHTDKTVTIDKGEHPFVRRETNVAYGEATFTPAAKLETALARNVAKLQPDLSKKLLDRVRTGLIASSRTPNSVAEYCRHRFDR